MGVVFALHGCASHELRLRIAGDKILNQGELEQLFYAERTVRFSSSSGSATVKYHPDGRQEIEWENGKDIGHFRIESEEFCSTWARLRHGAESCSKVYRITEEEYEFISSDGSLSAIMHLK
jgi:hypothetical protein